MGNLPVNVDLRASTSVIAGAWADNINDLWQHNHYYECTTDAAELNFILDVPEDGTYTIALVGYASVVGQGITDVYIDGTEVASYDWHTGVATNNYKFSTAGIVLSAGLQTVRLVTDGKTGAHFNVDLGRFCIWRTA